MTANLLNRTIGGVTAALVLLGAGAPADGTAQAQFRRYDRSYVYRIASDRGFQAGLDRGAEDARNHRRYDPNNSQHYRDGDSGYHSQYGIIQAYRAAYREGFRRGYAQGYGRYRGFWGRGRR